MPPPSRPHRQLRVAAVIPRSHFAMSRFRTDEAAAARSLVRNRLIAEELLAERASCVRNRLIAARLRTGVTRTGPSRRPRAASSGTGELRGPFDKLRDRDCTVSKEGAPATVSKGPTSFLPFETAAGGLLRDRIRDGRGGRPPQGPSNFGHSTIVIGVPRGSASTARIASTGSRIQPCETAPVEVFW
jgi:hypothetical protein